MSARADAGRVTRNEPTGNARSVQIPPALLSIIITNYNYAGYLGAAIASALAVDWPRVEVIVVDDGSTDRSRDVIEKFGPREIEAVFLQNCGQAAAAMHGFRRSRGEWIIFLDSDDLLDPSIVREAAEVMRSGWSMIQFQMKGIDHLGRPLNRIFPKYKPGTRPEEIRRWAAETGAYPTPPTSGNLLARSFLDQIFPFAERMDYAIDSYFVSTAPFLGDVLTVYKPLASYRIHGQNDSAQYELDLGKISRDLRRHVVRSGYAARIAARHGFRISPDCWRYGFYNLGMRLASIRLAPDRHPIDGDTRLKCLADLMRAVTRPQGLSPRHHAALAAWLLAVAVAPKSLAQMLVAWRFAISSRPRVVERLIASG
jgi:glycosyltransferase involved in cell wall biosynthesis